MNRPNILLMTSHDTGRYVQPYGHPVPTPTMQNLAEEGVLFRQAFCAGPTCSPSRASLLTGSYPHQKGMLGLAHRGFDLRDSRRHLQAVLQQAGYFTALSGVQHVIHVDRIDELGYDAVLTQDVSHPHISAERFLDTGPRQPFYLEVGFLETHREFPESDPDIRPEYTQPPPILPNTPETRTDFARFKASARVLDDKVKTVLEALDRNNLRNNTLVICTTDHGIAFPQMKCNLTDHGIGVMLIMRGPGGLDGGKVVDAMVSHLDLFPTICELAGVSAPEWLQGVSLRPLANGEVQEIREQVSAEVNYHAAYEPMRCIRTRRFKYIQRFDGRSRPVMPNCDEGESIDLWLSEGWAQHKVDEEQLYDLVFDPMERHNLAGDPKWADVLRDMSERLHTFMSDTDDPLLNGPIPAPKGAKVNSPDDLSPNDPVATA